MLQLYFSDWLAIAGGIGAIAWVNWYFFFAERATAAIAAAAPKGGAGAVAEATITVAGGYDPSTVRVRAGQPVRLTFDRRDTSSCSEEIVLPDFGIRKFLPSGQRTVVEVTPPAAGAYDFMCGMSMLRGRLIAEA
jgi:plastocyanin domain-containing protein